MERDKLINKIVSKLRKKGAIKIALFGSYARHEERKNSDIDIIVDFNKNKSLLELVKIERELFEATGKKVDMLTERSISPYIIDGIKKEMEVIYS